VSTQDLNSLIERLAIAEAQIIQLRRARPWRVAGPMTLIISLASAAAYMISPALHAYSIDGQTIEAPFTVTSHGHTIMQVKASSNGDQNQILLYKTDGSVPVAALIANEVGMVIVSDGKGNEESDGFKGMLAAGPRGGLLELSDADNKVMVEIGKGPHSQGLAVYRPGTEKIAINAFANESKATLAVRSLNDQPSGLTIEDGVALDLYDNTGQPFALLSSGEQDPDPGTPADPDKRRGLIIYNKKGAQAGRFAIDSKEQGYLAVQNEANAEAFMGMNLDGKDAEIILAGPGRSVGASLSSNNPSGLWLYGANGQMMLELTTTDTGGKIIIDDFKGSIMLDGEVTQSGRGVFRAGPVSGGPIELTGLPNTVMGRKQ
jgi:hypothetical protein